MSKAPPRSPQLEDGERNRYRNNKGENRSYGVRYSPLESYCWHDKGLNLKWDLITKGEKAHQA